MLNSNARTVEEHLLGRCVDAARLEGAFAIDAIEANVFLLSASMVRTRHPGCADRLALAGEHYFCQHPQSRVGAAEVVRRGWLLGLPRWRDMLSRKLDGAAA